jgi:hypothetical protein
MLPIACPANDDVTGYTPTGRAEGMKFTDATPDPFVVAEPAELPLTEKETVAPETGPAGAVVRVNVLTRLMTPV